jgi:superkiller protein 3
MLSPILALAAIAAILVGLVLIPGTWEQQPTDAVAHYDRGAALLDQGKPVEAIAEFRAAIRLKPELVYAHIGLANALDEQGKSTEAIAEYREAIRLKPDEVLAHYNLALALGRQGKT